MWPLDFEVQVETGRKIFLIADRGTESEEKAAIVEEQSSEEM